MNNLENPFKDYKKIHCIGIGGSGMFPIVRYSMPKATLSPAATTIPGIILIRKEKWESR